MEGDVGIYRGDTGYGGYVWGLGRYGEMTHLQNSEVGLLASGGATGEA